MTLFTDVLTCNGVKLTSIVSLDPHPDIVSVTFKKYSPLVLGFVNVIVSSFEIKFSTIPELFES